MSRADTGERAAYGRHSRTATKLRRGVHRSLRLAARPLRRDEVDGLVFVPAVRDASELADVVGRITWYLPDLSVPVWIEGQQEFTPVAADAPHLDPSLIDASVLADARPGGRVRYVLHRVTVWSLLRQLPRLRRTTVASAVFSYTSENGYARLRDVLSRTVVPDAKASVERLLARAVPQGTSLALGTGPTASDVTDDTAADVRVICNSAVRNRELVLRMDPTVIAFADPVFHFGPSRYAAAFRADLVDALEQTTALAVMPANFVGLFTAHFPHLADRVVGLRLDGEAWGWPAVDKPAVRATGNVLTNMMLPVALALTDRVLVAGCDGRKPDEKYFWNHNPAIQYDDTLMRTVFDAHPAFFRSISYTDYYDRHCQSLEELCQVAEAAGKQVRGLTRSHIPALLSRGAPSF